MPLMTLGLTLAALVELWSAARDGASESVQGWLLLLAGFAWGMTVWFAVKATSDEAQAQRFQYEERVQQEQRRR